MGLDYIVPVAVQVLKSVLYVLYDTFLLSERTVEAGLHASPWRVYSMYCMAFLLPGLVQMGLDHTVLVAVKVLKSLLCVLYYTFLLPGPV